MIQPNRIAGGLRVRDEKNLKILENQKSDIQRHFMEHLEWNKKRVGITLENIDTTENREDAHHQASTKILRKASAIGIETLNISGLLKNRKLAKAL